MPLVTYSMLNLDILKLPPLIDSLSIANAVSSRIIETIHAGITDSYQITTIFSFYY